MDAAMGLTSWASFTRDGKTPGHGDLVLTEDQISGIGAASTYGLEGHRASQ